MIRLPFSRTCLLCLLTVGAPSPERLDAIDKPLPRSARRSILVPPTVAAVNSLKNGGFETWNPASPRIPAEWSFEQIYRSPTPFSRSARAVHGDSSARMSNNSQGEHFLYQYVGVSTGTVYTAQVIVEGTTRNHSPLGIYLRGARNFQQRELIAWDEVNFLTEGVPRILKARFYTGDDPMVIVRIGFPKGMNASVRFDCASIVPDGAGHDYRYARDVVALIRKETGFDDAWTDRQKARRLTAFVNQTLQWPRRRRLAFARKHFLELPAYWRTFASIPEKKKQGASYCQKISLSAAECLALFGIQTRQRHATNPQNQGFHQIFEYFDRDDGRWIALDGFFGVEFADGDRLLDIDESARIFRERKDLSTLARKIPVNHFYFSGPELAAALEAGWTTGIGMPMGNRGTNVTDHVAD